jgi:hypothetical protein
VVYNCSWPSPAQPFSVPSAMGLVTIFYCFRFETSVFVASCDSKGYGGGIRPRLHTGELNFQRQCYVTTDCQSASLSWNKAPIWGLRPDFYYYQTIVGLLMWGILSEKRTGLCFTMYSMFIVYVLSCIIHSLT